ncbi:antibiotic biosynthesis monooxygenase [Geobacter sp. FeAm09]|uniref:antibiotic biosynthesis monooxygenase n=1 Tax=Geobacter sp. FeAm09 TaxID=2597769 RepID=UPI0011ECB292|nr:antibiotic biosynthesis monooxygenase [Geobacter sp. FeAm09]QEM67620.1 antibiotic biosynthesis monooxygenase [Geobacter sp. FeAm09]
MNTYGTAEKPAEVVAVLTLRTVRTGCEERFEAELHDFIARSLHAEGQLGVHVLRPEPGTGSREYGIVRRFGTGECRDRFYASSLFRQWEAAVAPLTEGAPQRQEVSGLETWFTLPGHQALVPPPRWKMAVVTVLGVWPVSMLVPWLLNPFITNLSQLLQALAIAVGIVIVLTWAVMPVLARMLRPWLGHRPQR